MVKKSEVTSETIKSLLDERHGDTNKSMIAFEVADGTGSSASRRADAVSFEFWPSRGMKIVGYEVKVSRSDWLTELNSPEKSLSVSQYCDRWYLVAPKGILRPDELPKSWGYIEATPKRLITKIKAPARDNDPMDIYFAASMIRSCLKKYADPNLIRAISAKIRREEREMIDGCAASKLLGVESRFEALRKRVSDFEDRSGITIDSWSFKEAADAIKYLSHDHKRRDLLEKVQHRIAQQEQLLSSDRDALKSLENWPAAAQQE